MLGGQTGSTGEGLRALTGDWEYWEAGRVNTGGHQGVTGSAGGGLGVLGGRTGSTGWDWEYWEAGGVNTGGHQGVTGSAVGENWGP